jgi:hypothetical protein
MKSRLLKEIAKTVRALEQLAIDWEKHFPENEEEGSRIKVRRQRRRFSQVLMTPPQLVTARDINDTRSMSGRWRVRERRAAVNKW